MTKSIPFLIVTLLLVSFQPISIAAPTGDTESYTYALTQSTAAYQLWTTPPSKRAVFRAEIAGYLGRLVGTFQQRILASAGCFPAGDHAQLSGLPHPPAPSPKIIFSILGEGAGG